ncbi:MAG: wax ester/triacylglycerol synthase family O-acyltransferase [Acidimicrobiales bacterium]
MTERPAGASQQMEPFDYLMFRGEGDPRSRASLASVSLLDRTPDIEHLRSVFDRASRSVLRLRQRVVAPALPVTAAQWVVDPDFDLTYHVRRVRAPAPGGLRDVLDLATTIMGAPLDTSRPLWEALLVEDVHTDGASAALILKVNHSLTDGVGAVELLRQLYDFERNADRGSMPHLPVPEDRSPIDLVAAALRRAPIQAVAQVGKRLGGLVGRVVRVVRNPSGAVHGARSMAGSVQRLGPLPASASPLLRRRGLGRRLETVDVPLDELRAAAKAVGCTINDAYVSAICGALRRYHEELGVPVDALTVAIPVSQRTDDDPLGGNRFTATRFAAPVGVIDPVERMRLIGEVVHAAVNEPAVNADAFGAAGSLLSHLPASLLSVLMSRGGGSDVQVSNIRGYPGAPYVAGAEILKSYWFGPLMGGAVMVVLMSQGGTCFIGAQYDTAAVSDGELFARCLREGFDEVLAGAPKQRSATRAAPVKKAPVAKAPVKAAPVKKAPVKASPGKKPVVKKAPVAKAPVKKAPVGTAPVGTAGVGTAPIENAAVESASVGETPVKETPVETAPVGMETVVTEPVKETPVVTAPIVTEPVKETFAVSEPVVTEPVVTEPVKETPVETAPVVETPVEAAPVVETPVETEPGRRQGT